MSSRIEDYGLIGDCETAALVSKGGSIDWLCWPRFNSGACFSALLGDTNHGRWSIAPAAVASDIKVSRPYAHNTLILEDDRILAVSAGELGFQVCWTEPDPPRFYPLREVEQGSRHYSARRTPAALNRRDVIIDLPAFLPPRNSSEYRQRKTVNRESR